MRKITSIAVSAASAAAVSHEDAAQAAGQPDADKVAQARVALLLVRFALDADNQADEQRFAHHHPGGSQGFHWRSRRIV